MYRGTAVAILSLVSLSTHAASEVTFTGKARIRFEDTVNYDPDALTLGSKRETFSSIRIRPRLDVKAGPAVKLAIEPQFSKKFGQMSGVNPTSGSTANPAPDENSVFLHQGFLDWSVSERFSFLAGRQALSYGDQYIIGPSDWGVTGRAFDAYLVRFSSDLVKVDLAQAKVETAIPMNGDDRDLFFAYSQWKVAEWMKELDLYVLHETDKVNTANKAASKTGAGTRFKAAFGGFEAKAEYANNVAVSGFVASNSKNREMVDAEVSYLVYEPKQLQIAFQYYWAGANWLDWYPTTKSALGRIDTVGRRNLTGEALHVRGKFSDQFKGAVSAYLHSRTSTGAPAYHSGGKAVGTAGGSSSKELGNQVDASVSYKANDQLDVGVGVGYMSVGKYYKDQTPGGIRHLQDLYVQFLVSF